MKATEAKALADTTRDIDGSFLRKETDNILTVIKDTAESGKYGVQVLQSIYGHPIIIERLERLGYKVKCRDDQRDGFSMDILWGVP